MKWNYKNISASRQCKILEGPIPSCYPENGARPYQELKKYFYVSGISSYKIKKKRNMFEEWYSLERISLFTLSVTFISFHI